jgi:ABC-2 type transport system permease protein
VRLANVYTKTAAERWRAMVIGSLTMVAFLLMAMAVYRDIDLSIYTNLPEVFRSVVGIEQDEGVAGLAYNAVYSSYAALVIFSVTVAIGAGAIAGEERRGTFGLLLASPVSRTRVLISKAAVLVTMAALGIGLLWAGGLVVPRVLDVNVTDPDVGALLVHMFAGALFFGFLALAVGAWSGNNGLAIAVAAGIMVLSFFAVGLLPLVEGLEDLVKALPWYYYSGSDPLVNGIDWGHIAVLLLGTVLLGAMALIGVNRRDLRESSTPVTLTDRLRSLPLTGAMVDRLAGSARVSSIWTKTASEHQGLLLVVCVSMLALMTTPSSRWGRLSPSSYSHCSAEATCRRRRASIRLRRSG